MSSVIRIALAQINTTVGDLEGNARLVREWTTKAKAAGADIVAFPELTLTGYPPEDLLLYQPFVAQNEALIRDLAKEAEGIVVIVGFAERDAGPSPDVPASSPGTPARMKLYNSAAVLAGGSVAHVYRKIYLPNYGVFDEKRYFTPGDECSVLDLNGVKVAVNVCEDVWFPAGPSEVQCAAGAELVITINGSPYEMGKERTRVNLVRGVARRNRAYAAFVNMVGGQDELVFDGGSMVAGPDGEVTAASPMFEEDLLVIDLDMELVRRARSKALPMAVPDEDLRKIGRAGHYSLPPLTHRAKPSIPAPQVRAMGRAESVYRALVLGTRDYMRKTGFQKVLIGMSGGMDSTIVCAIAADALGPENVTGVAMPSRFNAESSFLDAAETCRRLGVRLWTVPIEQAHSAFEQMLAEPYRGAEPNVAEENVQARIRGNVLMSLSNKFGWLVLTTGNKSEMATGYATLYGDMAGGYAVIKDVPKTLVYEISRWRNSAGPGSPIPQAVIDKAPTAELKPNQKDQDTLPPYSVLDRVLEMYIEKRMSPAGIADAESRANGEHADEETVRRVVKMVDRSEYKRRQAPPGVKITGLAFGRDRRLPIASRWKSWEQ
ncbi:MAG: NAD+ synthase [Dehalococcoidia bacterium]|nr:NAD+ synthase [Dehalococcoidia bacterium]